MFDDARAVFRRQSGKVAAFSARQGERVGLDEDRRAGVGPACLFQHEAEGVGVGHAQCDLGVSFPLIDDKDAGAVARRAELIGRGMRRVIVFAETRSEHGVQGAVGFRHQGGSFPA